MVQVNIVNIDDLDESVDGDCLYRGKLFTGVSYEREEAQGVLVGLMGFFNGKPHGAARGWETVGRIKYERYYYIGALHGPYREWDESGRLVYESYRECGFSLWEREWSPSRGLATKYRIESSPGDRKELDRTRERRGPISVVDIDLQTWQFVERPPGWYPEDMQPPG